jgi:hypothetical protein
VEIVLLVGPPSNEAEPPPAEHQSAPKPLTLKALCDPYYANIIIQPAERTRRAAASASANEVRKAPSRPLASVAAPQLEFIDGRMVVRESSLMVGNEPNMTLEEGELQNPATYTSYRLKSLKSTARWGIEETRAFYTALRQVGQDYSLMQTFLPGRTRQQIKKKFFSEDKSNPALTRGALNSRIPVGEGESRA